MPKWVYPLAFAFVLYYIFTDGGAAGEMGRGFAGFLGNGLDALGEFFAGLTGGGEVSVDQPSTQPPTTLVP